MKWKKTIYITVRYNSFLIYFGSSFASPKTDFHDLEQCLRPRRRGDDDDEAGFAGVTDDSSRDAAMLASTIAGICAQLI
jgi:hypothetical protein